MAVERTSATRLRVEERPYTTLPNEVVQGITNPDALAIWTYLQSQSTGWKVVAKHIKNHFGIGRDRYRAAMAYLAERGLVSYVSERNEAGHLLGQEIVVHHSPRVQETGPSVESPRVQKTRPSDLPTVGESDPLERDQGVDMDQEPQDMDQHPTSSAGADAGGDASGVSEKGQRAADIQTAFNRFWSAGMVKVGKKTARRRFETLAKGVHDPLAFGDMLVEDIKHRLNAGVLGFDRLHPTTYLNQERWNDDVVPGDKPGGQRAQHHNLDYWSGDGLSTTKDGRKTL